MILKGRYADRPALYQLFVLLLLVLAGAVFSALIGMIVFFACYGLHADLYLFPNALRWFQLFTVICTFLLPSLGTAWLCSRNPKGFLWVGKMPDIKALLFVLLALLLFTPLVSLSDLLNKQVVFPDFMHSIEAWMREKELQAKQMTDLLLLDSGWMILLFNLLVIAVAAGITEEFLFRGALQRIVGRWTTNHHVVIWVVAFLFSAFHLQFFGLIPRILLGVFLGYLLYWSRNIWIPVFAHFLNNAFAVIGMSDSRLKNSVLFSEDVSNDLLLPLAGVTVVSLLLFFLLVKKLKKVLAPSVVP